MTLLLAFAAGLLTILSPCVLPLAPVVVAGAAAQDPRGPLALALGLALTFGTAGALFAGAGLSLGGDLARPAAAALALIAGLVMLVSPLRRRAEAFFGRFARWGETLDARRPAGLLGFAAAGAALAFLWAPCVGPTLGAAFALAASGGSLAAAGAVMTAFALGAALALLAAGYGLRRLAAARRLRLQALAGAGRTAFALLLVGLGASVLTGFDREIEAAALRASPRWLIALTTAV
ncbi:cytochrome c biogenesis protein CcdA [Methylocella sp.]|uniref:urease accessory protein UreH domain-containing protein n=1 Tax=Methylocella sp. TaxID=1978226 RepID=UPI003784B546